MPIKITISLGERTTDTHCRDCPLWSATGPGTRWCDYFGKLEQFLDMAARRHEDCIRATVGAQEGEKR